MAAQDDVLVADVTLAVRDFKRALQDMGTLSNQEQMRIADAAQHLVADVGKATQDSVRRKLTEAGVL